MENAIPQELVLEEATLVRIQDGRGLVVRAIEGALWLTQESDLRDIELSAGQSFRIERNGLTLLHAMQRSRIVIDVHTAAPATHGLPVQQKRRYVTVAKPAGILA